MFFSMLLRSVYLWVPMWTIDGLPHGWYPGRSLFHVTHQLFESPSMFVWRVSIANEHKVICIEHKQPKWAFKNLILAMLVILEIMLLFINYEVTLNLSDWLAFYYRILENWLDQGFFSGKIYQILGEGLYKCRMKTQTINYHEIGGASAIGGLCCHLDTSALCPSSFLSSSISPLGDSIA